MEHRILKLFIVTYCVEIVFYVEAGVKKDKEDTTTTKIHPKYPEDSEPLSGELHIPHNWTQQSEEAEFLGLLFAGKSEFNWIVDIRLVDHDQEKWSVGNLISVIHVMTTCRAITNLAKDFQIEDGKSTLELLDADMRVNYCTQFLWEDSELDSDTNTVPSSGTRLIQTVTPHPKCTLESFLHDFGVIELSRGINPYVPAIGYMPVNKKLSSGLIVNPHLNNMELRKWVCYVASYGKPYRNLKNSMVQDYKVKHRVYYTDWAECEKYQYYVCPIHIRACDFSHIKRKNIRKLMCFRPRKKVGAICDHDRGAPLVCEGFVYGIVVRGAQFPYCHDLTPFPVIILKTHVFIEDFSSLIRFQHVKVVPDDDEEQHSTSKCTLIDRSHVIRLATALFFNFQVFVFCHASIDFYPMASVRIV